MAYISSFFVNILFSFYKMKKKNLGSKKSPTAKAGVAVVLPTGLQLQRFLSLFNIKPEHQVKI